VQRKNGLFKKAYELGVLCSVDIAVIVFGPPSSSPKRRLACSRAVAEHKPGHNPKVFEYCSADTRALVARYNRVRRARSAPCPRLR
jgi:MADS-box transcription factor